MYAVLGFLSSPVGRVVRAVSGALLMLVGIMLRNPAGYVLAIIGLVPLVAGVLDFCLFAPLFKLPLQGDALRTKLKK